MIEKNLVGKVLKLSLLSGFVLAGFNYMLPRELMIGGTIFIGGFIGYLVFVVVENWNRKKSRFLNLTSAIVATSLWASICLSVACSVYNKIPQCSSRGENVSGILFFLVPVTVVVVGAIIRPVKV